MANKDFFEALREIAESEPKHESLPPIQGATPFPKCARCHSFDVANDGDNCEQCTTELNQGYEILSMLGRLANGAQLGHGTRFHAVKFDSNKALCGAQPGRRRSVGWTFDPRGHGKAVTCPRCIKKLERLAKNDS